MSTPRLQSPGPGSLRAAADADIPKSPSFAFLAQHNPLLVRYGAQAEQLPPANFVHFFTWPARQYHTS